MISLDNQRFMAERMGATVRSHPVDHMLLLAAPEVVTDVLLEVAKKVQKDLTQA
jgi:hypothetical protein